MTTDTSKAIPTVVSDNRVAKSVSHVGQNPAEILKTADSSTSFIHKVSHKQGARLSVTAAAF